MPRLVLVLAIALSGCSFAFVSGPPDNHRELPVVDCTTGRAGPILDTIWTGLQSLNLVFAISQSNEEVMEATNISRTVAIPLYASLAALGAAGMYYGYSRTGACRRAKAELMLRQTSPMGAQQPGTWPPPAPAPVAPAPAPVAPAPAPDGGAVPAPVTP